MRHLLSCLAAVLALGLTACAEDPQPAEVGQPGAQPLDPSEETSSETTTPSPEPSTTAPSTRPSEDESEGPPDDDHGGGGDMAEAQLSAKALPAPPSIRWRSRGTLPGEGQSPAWVCQPASLTAIGATRVGTQQFVSGSATVSATQQVVKFADEQSAQRGYAVLDAWLRKCGEQLRSLDHEPIRVPRQLTNLPVDADQAGWAVLFYRTADNGPDEAQIETITVVRDDDMLSLVVYRQVGQDYNYDPGQSPPERVAPLLAEAL